MTITESVNLGARDKVGSLLRSRCGCMSRSLTTGIGRTGAPRASLASFFEVYRESREEVRRSTSKKRPFLSLEKLWQNIQTNRLTRSRDWYPVQDHCDATIGEMVNLLVIGVCSKADATTSIFEQHRCLAACSLPLAKY